MSKLSIASWIAALACVLALSPAASGAGELVRQPVDTVGFGWYGDQIDDLVRIVDSLEAWRYEKNAAAVPEKAARPMIGAVCPHDDYLYAARIYAHVMREVKAPLAVLIGVSHTARRRGIQDKLVFDDYAAWRGAYGDCRISKLRGEVIKALPADLVLVSDEMMGEEHSLEPFVPFLQHYRRDVEILPIIVTRLAGERFSAAADTLAGVLSTLMRERGLVLGRDVVILVSADCVHYGDENWGGRPYAPFGAGIGGYEKAVAQDMDVIESSLVGPVSPERIGVFRQKVENNDFRNPYKITWCGVYSIPFGLSVLGRLAALAGRPAPVGHLLAYGTSIDPGELPNDRLGLGVTNVNTLSHWVGYAAIGYW